MEDSSLGIFKWADFDPIDDDEKLGEKIEDSNKPGTSREEERMVTAENAANGIGNVRDSRFGRANDDAGIPLFGPLRLPPHIALDRPLFLSLSHLV